MIFLCSKENEIKKCRHCGSCRIELIDFEFSEEKNCYQDIVRCRDCKRKSKIPLTYLKQGGKQKTNENRSSFIHEIEIEQKEDIVAKFTKEQIAAMRVDTEAGMSTKAICEKHDIAEANLYYHMNKNNKLKKGGVAAKKKKSPKKKIVKKSPVKKSPKVVNDTPAVEEEFPPSIEGKKPAKKNTVFFPFGNINIEPGYVLTVGLVSDGRCFFSVLKEMP